MQPSQRRWPDLGAANSRQGRQRSLSANCQIISLQDFTIHRFWSRLPSRSRNIANISTGAIDTKSLWHASGAGRRPLAACISRPTSVRLCWRPTTTSGGANTNLCIGHKFVCQIHPDASERYVCLGRPAGYYVADLSGWHPARARQSDIMRIRPRQWRTRLGPVAVKPTWWWAARKCTAFLLLLATAADDKQGANALGARMQLYANDQSSCLSRANVQLGEQGAQHPGPGKGWRAECQMSSVGQRARAKFELVSERRPDGRPKIDLAPFCFGALAGRNKLGAPSASA